MTRVLLIAAVTAAVIVAAVVAGGGGGGDRAGSAAKGGPVVLRLANANGDSRELQPFVDAVARRSGGALRIEVHNTWRGGDAHAEAGLVDDVAAGHAELGWTGARAFHDLGVRDFDALVAPFLIDSYGLEEKVVRDPLAGRMLDGLDTLGVEGLGVLPGPMRKPLGAEPLRARATGPVPRSRTRARRSRARRCARSARTVRDPVGGGDRRQRRRRVPLAAIRQPVRRLVGALAANVNLWPRPLVSSGTRTRWPGSTRVSARRSTPPRRTRSGRCCVRARRRPRRRGHPLPPRRGVRAREPRRSRRSAQRGGARVRVAVRRCVHEGRDRAHPVLCGRPAPPRAGVFRRGRRADRERPPEPGRRRLALGHHAARPGARAGLRGRKNNPGNTGHFRMELRDGSFAVTGSSDGVDVRGVSRCTATGSRSSGTARARSPTAGSGTATCSSCTSSERARRSSASIRGATPPTTRASARARRSMATTA